MKDQDFQRRLLATYRVEAQEHLNGISSGLMELERAPAPEQQAPVIETIFRQAHSLKGAARSVNATDVENVCQALENVFAKLKRHELTPSLEVLDTLHKSVDSLHQLLWAGEAGADLPHERAHQTREQLSLLLEPATAGQSPTLPPPSVEAPAAEPPPGPESTAHALEKTPSPETVRIAAAKLNRVLFQAEEMLSAKLAASQRAADLDELHHTLAAWHQQWSKLRNRPHPAPRPALEPAPGPSSAPSPLAQFLSWNEEFFLALEKKLAAAARSADHDLRALSQMVDRLLEDTKDALMLPFASVFEMLASMARNLAREQGKELNVQLHGGDTAIDRRILEDLKAPFIHLVRNCVDHGIELPQERRRKQKPPRGTLTIRIAQKTSATVEIVVADDGAGINPADIRDAALKAGLRSAQDLQALSDQQLLGLCFESGVSTTPLLTDVSGRGLGLAIVREKVEKLGGAVALESQPGAGVSFRLLLPLTLARFRGVLVTAAGQPFIVPTAAIEGVARIPPADIHTVQHRETVQLNGQTLPLSRLARVLAIPAPAPSPAPPTAFPVLVLAAGETRLALLVDTVLAEQEVLMKNLGPQLPRVRNIAGATVLGNGTVVPILTVHDLVKSALRSPAAPPAAGAHARAPKPRPKSILVVEDSITSRTLLKNILHGAGYRVDTAVDGLDAFMLLQTKPYDLVVSDVQMPRLNGFDLTSRIRSDRQLASLPVVLVTVLASPEERERGIDAGANAYLVKTSFDQSNLLDIVARLMAL